MSLAALIEEIDHLSITANNRVKCSITGPGMGKNPKNLKPGQRAAGCDGFRKGSDG